VTRQERLVASAALKPTSELLLRASLYLRRRRRIGLAALAVAMVAAIGPFAGDADISLSLPRVLAGYLVGLLALEYLAPRLPRPAVRAASLHARSTTGDAPRFGLLLAIVALAPLLAAPALALGWHPRGSTSRSSATSDCSANADWPHTGTLVATSLIAAVALLTTWLVLRRLSARARPAEDPELLALDKSLRTLTARSTVGAASALGLILLSLLGQAVYTGAHSWTCARAIGNTSSGNVYSWAPLVDPWLEPMTLALLCAAIVVGVVYVRIPPVHPHAQEG
jgi:hypothetical protein